jgi:hypothetical protein
MKMPRSELVIIYPTAGEVVTPGFIARGETPDSGVCIKVYVEDNAGNPIHGTVLGPQQNRGGGTWLAKFPPLAPGPYKLVALIETREDIQVAPAGAAVAARAAGGWGPPGVLAIAILIPPAGGAVSNPITIYGTVSAAGCQVTCTITDCNGNPHQGNITGPDANGNWSASFAGQNIPSGSAKVCATVTQGGNQTTTCENITVE